MTTGTTGQLGLALPVQGELSGTWGDTVNNGITQYTNIAIAGTLTLTGDGAVTLANTTGDASASNVTSSLTGAGTVTAQFAIVRVTGTLTTAKVVTGPSYSKTYTVVNAATGGIVTFKASGQTGVSVAVGETAFVYFNGTDYVKVVGTATAGAAGGSNTQVQFNSSGILAGSANMTFNGTTLTVNDLTDSSLTATRIVFAGTAGNLTDSANLTWNGTSLSATQIDITAQGPLRLQDTTGGEYVGLRSPSALGASYTLTFPADDGTSGQALITDGSGGLSWSTAASGDVYGPASATANGIALFDGTTGKIIKDSAAQDGLIYGLTVGRGAGAVSTNTAVGASALAANVSGTNSVAVGASALAGQTTGGFNTAVGQNSMSAIVTGSSNTTVGVNSMVGNTSGANNAALGGAALFTNTSGANNTAIGTASLQNNLTASNNTAVGYQALYGTTTASNNTAMGYQAGYQSTYGNNNTLMGYQAAYNINPASLTDMYIVAIGHRAGFQNTTGTNNTYVGGLAGPNTTASTGSYNTALGYAPLYKNTSGANNIAIGSIAVSLSPLNENTTGSYNVAIGNGSLALNLSGTYNTAVGYRVAETNSTGTNNSYFGSFAGQYNTGSYNTAVGYAALSTVTNPASGGNNTAVGFQAGTRISSGTYNTAIGNESLQFATTGVNNNALGYQAGSRLSTGSYSLFLGSRSGSSGATALTGDSNTAVGEGSGYQLEGAATSNVFLGQDSGSAVTTGSRNVIIGTYTGNSNGLDIRTGNDNIVLATGGAVPKLWISGGTTYFRGNGTNNGSLYIQSANATISVSTSPVTISTGAAWGAIVMVAGYQASNQFADLVYFGYNGANVVLASTTVVGAPTSRTYSGSIYDLTLQMGSGTYSVTATSIINNAI